MYVVPEYIELRSMDELLREAPIVAIAHVVDVLQPVVTARNADGPAGSVHTPLRIRLDETLTDARKPGTEEVILQLGGTAEGLTLIDETPIMTTGTTFLLFASDRFPANSDRSSGMTLLAFGHPVLGEDGTLTGGGAIAPLVDGRRLDDVVDEILASLETS
jgi:hypothetical protein